MLAAVLYGVHDRRLEDVFVPSDFDEVMRLMAAGAYPTDGWVEHEPLAQVLTEGFEPLLAGRRTKVLIDLPLHV